MQTPHGLTPTPALRSQSRRRRKEGNPGAGEPRMRRRGRGAGDVVVPGGGGIGAGTRHGLKGEREGEGGAGRRGPSPRRHSGWACYSSRRSAGTRAAPVTRGVAPPLPCPGLEPSPTRVAGDGAEAAAASRPHLPHHPSVPLDIWTLGPAPTGLRKPSPPSPAVRLAPPSLRSPQPSCRLDFRLPLDAPSRSPPSPPAPAGSGGRREGGVRPAASPPRPAPRDSPCMAGPGGGDGGARAPCGRGTRGVAVPVPM